MEQNIITQQLPASMYAGCRIVLTTKHKKALALAAVFKEKLAADVVEHYLDTDQLGTFTGEIARPGTALACAKKKCILGLRDTGAAYGLASEGSFGPHPYMPFLSAGTEILYFIDQNRKFKLHVAELSSATNYQTAVIDNMEAVFEFASKALFPSHALIVQPYPLDVSQPIFKGLQDKAALAEAYLDASNCSLAKKVLLTTDMRAHLNPTRRQAIAKVGASLAARLASLCPRCNTPGWGKVDVAVGLPCRACGAATAEVKAEIFACVTCRYKEKSPPSHGQRYAEAAQCADCNP